MEDPGVLICLLILFFAAAGPVIGPIIGIIGTIVVVAIVVAIVRAIARTVVDAKKNKSAEVNISSPSKKQNPISEYLFQSSVKGIPESEAINRLLANGWSQEQINEAQK